MKNLMKKLNAKKNDKGFTLVELIIVIAIIAILTVVLAPTYTKYVEKSRISKDDNNAASIETAVKTAIIDLAADADSTNDVTEGTVTFDKTGIDVAITAALAGDSSLETALTETLGSLTSATVTNTTSGHQTYTITISTTAAGVTTKGAWS